MRITFTIILLLMQHGLLAFCKKKPSGGRAPLSCGNKSHRLDSRVQVVVGGEAMPKDMDILERKFSRAYNKLSCHQEINSCTVVQRNKSGHHLFRLEYAIKGVCTDDCKHVFASDNKGRLWKKNKKKKNSKKYEPRWRSLRHVSWAQQWRKGFKNKQTGKNKRKYNGKRKRKKTSFQSSSSKGSKGSNTTSKGSKSSKGNKRKKKKPNRCTCKSPPPTRDAFAKALDKSLEHYTVVRVIELNDSKWTRPPTPSPTPTPTVDVAATTATIFTTKTTTEAATTATTSTTTSTTSTSTSTMEEPSTSTSTSTPEPADPTPAPVDPTPAPVDPTPAPVDPTPAPVDSTPAPVDPTPAPVDPTPAPIDPTPAPVDPTPAPVDPIPPRVFVAPPVLAPEDCTDDGLTYCSYNFTVNKSSTSKEVLFDETFALKAVSFIADMEIELATTVGKDVGITLFFPPGTPLYEFLYESSANGPNGTVTRFDMGNAQGFGDDLNNAGTYFFVDQSGPALQTGSTSPLFVSPGVYRSKTFPNAPVGGYAAGNWQLEIEDLAAGDVVSVGVGSIRYCGVCDAANVIAR